MWEKPLWGCATNPRPSVEAFGRKRASFGTIFLDSGILDNAPTTYYGPEFTLTGGRHSDGQIRRNGPDSRKSRDLVRCRHGGSSTSETATHTLCWTRRVDAPRREGTPIGTRAAADLFFTVGGDEVELTVGKGFLSRRSYSVSALVYGVSLNFAPVDDANSAFTRDGLRIGHFSKNEESDPQTDRRKSGRARRAPTNLSSVTPWPKPSIAEHSTVLLR